MLKQTLNKGISTPMAIGIILVLVILVGSFTWLKYGETWREADNLSEIELPEKEESESSPKETYIKYREELDKTTNMEEMISVYHEYGSKNLIAGVEQIKKLTDSQKYMSFTMTKTVLSFQPIKDIKIEKLEIDDDSAFLILETGEVKLLKENSIWKIDSDYPNEQVCKKIPDNELAKHGCYISYINGSIAKKDFSICEEIPDELKGVCYSNIAYSEEDSSFCDKIQNNELAKEECYSGVNQVK